MCFRCLLSALSGFLRLWIPQIFVTKNCSTFFITRKFPQKLYFPSEHQQLTQFQAFHPQTSPKIIQKQIEKIYWLTLNEISTKFSFIFNHNRGEIPLIIFQVENFRFNMHRTKSVKESKNNKKKKKTCSFFFIIHELCTEMKTFFNQYDFLWKFYSSFHNSSWMKFLSYSKLPQVNDFFRTVCF